MTDTDVIAILGIPVDNLTLEQAVERMFAMVDEYASDRRARQVATVNVDFVVNTLSPLPGRVRHPELLNILRRADMVTADGMPLVVLSRLMKTPLKERVTGADLVPRLAEEAARRRKSIFFLGGRGDVGFRAAEILRDRYPGMAVAGVFSPFVEVEGLALTDATETDLEIVERINDVGPDILFIAFGNPKQEVWFDRNRHRLHVPVSIGVGGTFEFIAGTVRRAPLWVQKTGLEWIFRIIQDPLRLWKRYLIGFFKFSLLLWPVVLYSVYSRLGTRGDRRHRVEGNRDKAAPPATGAAAIRTIRLPASLTLQTSGAAVQEFDLALSHEGPVVLDFSEVSFIDPVGLGFLIRAWRRAEDAGKRFYLVGVFPKIRRFFEMNRSWDIFREHTFETMGDVWQAMHGENRSPSFFYSVSSGRDHLLIRMFGRLDAFEMSRLDVPELLDAVSGSDSILDLQSLRFIDSSGLALLLKLQRALAGRGRRLVLCGLNDGTTQLLRITRLYKLFEIAEDAASARQTLLEGP